MIKNLKLVELNISIATGLKEKGTIKGTIF